MVRELIELRTSIVEGRYGDALEIVDDLTGMGKQGIIRNIESYLLRLLIHLIKNQVEQRLTNSWAASIADSVRQIKKLNLKDNKTSYYIKQDEWQPYLEEAFDAAIFDASAEVAQGAYNFQELTDVVNRQEILAIAQNFLDLTYLYSARELLANLPENLANLPGGEEWLSKRK